MNKPKSGKRHIVTLNFGGFESRPFIVDVLAWYNDSCWIKINEKDEGEFPYGTDSHYCCTVNAKYILSSFEYGDIPD